MSDSADSFHALGDDHEESVRIAVSALGDMRNATPSHPSPSSPHSSIISISPSSPSLVTRVSHLPLVNSVLRTYEQGKASSRVVKYGAEMMESSVRSISRPVIDRLPVNVNQLDEFACRQLDRFDRYRRSNVTSPSAEDSPEIRPKLRTKTLDGTLGEDSIDRPSTCTHEWHSGETDSPRIPRWIESTNAYGSPHLPPPDSRSSTPTQVGEDSPNGKSLMHPHATSPGSQDTERRVAQRSRWQAVLLEAGGLSAALSDENMRRLKYCLHCLQYATAQIDAQILILRDFIASLHPLPPPSSSLRGSGPPSPSSSRRSVSQAHMRTLTDVRRDLVQTIRQVVDVVSKYAGGALPEPARTRVRGFILKLPQRWASKAGVNVPTSGLTVNGGPEAAGSGEREREREKDRERERDSVTAAASGSAATRRPNRRAQYRERGTGSDSRTSSRAPSPTSPRVPRNAYGGAPSYVVDGLQPNSNGDDGPPGDQPVSTGAAVVAAQRILTLATESLDMMRGVTGVMRDSLDRADAWVNRLRTVGIQRNGGIIVDAIPEEEDPQQPGHTHPSSSSSPVSSPRAQKRWHHRRGSSTYSATSAGEDDIESYYSYRSDHQPGLASPAMSAAGSGTSTAYSSTYNVSGAGLTGGSGPSTPGLGYMTPSGVSGGQGPQSPVSVLPIAPLGRMSLGPPLEGGKVNDAIGLGLHDVERMDVDDDG